MNDQRVDFLVAPLTPVYWRPSVGRRPDKAFVRARYRKPPGCRSPNATSCSLNIRISNPRAQRDFAARFGDLHVHPLYPHVDGVPEITLIETRPDYLPDNDNWHTDVTFIETPPFGAVLTPGVLPPSGGDTLWSSTVAAYLALSEPLRRLVDRLTAEHSFEKSFPRHRWGLGEKAAQWNKAVASNPPVVHPVVRTIEDGRRGLFVNSGFTSRILELAPRESDAMLRFLFEHMAKPEFTVRWRWKLGDVAFWDNRLSTHYATVDFFPHQRVMNRAAILGDRPH